MASPAQPRAQEMPPGCHWISLAHILPLAMVTDAPGCEAKALAQSTTYACDTVNLPEFSIMYLFWVLTLCTETAAHDCFFREKEKEKKTVGKEDTSFYALLVLCYACMCLAKGTRPISFGDLRPSGPATLAENPTQCPQAPPSSTSLFWMGHLGGKDHQVPTGSQGTSGGHPPVPSSCSQLRFVSWVLNICPWGRPTCGLGVAHHPADCWISQCMFPCLPGDGSKNSQAVTRARTHGHPLSRWSSGLWTSLSSTWTTQCLEDGAQVMGNIFSKQDFQNLQL